MSEVQLKVRDKIYYGWESATATRTLEAIAGAFEITAINKAGLDVFPGDNCELLLDGETVVSGYIDSIDYKISTSEQSLTVKGRDKTADLVDCSAINKTGEFLNVTLKELLTKIIEPFGIPVSYNVKPGETRAKVSLQQESAFEVIERETRKSGLFAYSDGKGKLLIDKIGAKNSVTSIVVGENALELSSSIDYSDRFSSYLVKGQQPGSGELTAQQSSKVFATATDKQIDRYRPLIVLSETSITTKQAQDRVQWEAAVRAARSEEITVTLQGWTQEDGSLWEINSFVDLSIPPLNFTGRKLIKQTSFKLAKDSGSICELILVDENSYIPEPDKVKKHKKNQVAPEAVDPDIEDFEYE